MKSVYDPEISLCGLGLDYHSTGGGIVTQGIRYTLRGNCLDSLGLLETQGSALYEQVPEQ